MKKRNTRPVPEQAAAGFIYVIKDNIHQLLLLLLLLLMMTGLSLASPFFLTWDNFRNILDHTALYVVLAIGMTFVIASGGIDLSVGSVAALSGVCMAVALKAGVPVPLAIIFGLSCGVLAGIFNGLIISALKINPFIVTLGSMSVARGIALIITGGIPIYGFARDFTWWGSGHIGPVNPPIIISFVLVMVGLILFHYTRFGYYTLAIGGNEEALRRSGVAVLGYKTGVYAICAFIASLAGLIVTARLNTAEPLAGWMFELDAIAAVVLGGTRMKGGVASISGTLIACFILGVLRNGLTILSIPSYYQQLLVGLIILSSVILAELRARKSDSLNA